MAAVRKPFQGVRNIIRFNWHFYALAFGLIGLFCMMLFYCGSVYHTYIIVIIIFVSLPILISLLVSLYIYDLSGLYVLKWLNEIKLPPGSNILNIHAGFDETSGLLQRRFPDSKLQVFDFYDAQKHTEVSIKRARKAYLPFKGTQHISTTYIPLPDSCIGLTLVMFAAHEIRQANERTAFFHELNRTLNNEGRIIVVEHMRDVLNFAAYNVGFFHFFSRSSWLRTFCDAKLFVEKEMSATAFVKIFVLNKNGSES